MSQLLVALLLTIVLSGSTGISNCPTGFPTVDTVRANAIFAGGFIRRDAQQAVFPDIKFTCGGSLTKWTIIASEISFGLNYPKLQIWRNTGGDDYERIVSTKITEEHSTSTPHVYEHLPNTPLEFQTGDILGVFTPPAPKINFQYQYHGGPKNYYVGGPPTQYDTFSLSSKTIKYDQPMIAIEVSNPSCTQGFVERADLLVKAGILSDNKTDLSYREATQRIIPNMTFPCNGAITKFTIAALSYGTRTKHPELQIWRREDDDDWQRKEATGDNTAVVRTVHLNVLEYVPIPPLPFQVGDILGIYQPYSSVSALQLYLEETGPENYYKGSLLSSLAVFDTDGLGVGTESRLPLVAVEISESSGTTTMPHPSPTTHPTLKPPSSTLHPTPIHTQTTNAPAHSRLYSVEAGLTALLVVCALLITTTVAALSVLLISRRKQYPSLRVVMNYQGRQMKPVATTKRALPPLPFAHEQSMDYNPMYRPGDPKEIITHGRRHTLELHPNMAYSSDQGQEQAAPAQSQTTDHIYDTID